MEASEASSIFQNSMITGISSDPFKSGLTENVSTEESLCIIDEDDSYLTINSAADKVSTVSEDAVSPLMPLHNVTHSYFDLQAPATSPETETQMLNSLTAPSLSNVDAASVLMTLSTSNFPDTFQSSNASSTQLFSHHSFGKHHCIDNLSTTNAEESLILNLVPEEDAEKTS